MNEFLKNVKTLILGSTLSKLIGIAAIPILTRLYSPEEFGVLSLYNSITLLIVPFMTLRYVVAIPLPKKDITSIHILWLCLYLSLGVSVVFFLILFLLKNLGVEYIRPLGNYAYLIPISAFLVSYLEVATYWLSRKESYRLISKFSVIQSIGGGVVKLSLSLVPISAFGLILGQMVQQFFFLPFFFGRRKKTKVMKKNIIKLLFIFSDFAKYRLPAHLMLVLSLQMPILAFSAMYDEDIVGQLSLATMLLTLPVTLVSNSVGKVYYSKVSSIGSNKPDEIYELTRRLTINLAKLSFPCTVLVYCFSPYLFTLFLGEDWMAAGKMASVMSVMLLFQFLSSPILNAFNIFKKQKIVLALNIVRVSLLVSLFAVCHRNNLTPMSTVSIFSATSSFYYLLVLCVIFRVIKNEVND
ncbi:lipopolysaccharide biosynthesis protein [Salinivibrio sp. KP-1]|uniref:lipopolysaccharide biosynthesis protein n=1 Tax=Salinivibrio sp. KP-1 TaxID=1406902 RepID=UPI00061449E2|nr:oligosaccharide flippase family protein [Salinivibrio sp. KP-1]KKA44114.1 hypothetical protein WN56_12925 [Salinivibrio sp. KP-1]